MHPDMNIMHCFCIDGPCYARVLSKMNSTKVQTLGVMVVHTVHKGCRGVHNTRHEERAPIIDGLGRSLPRPRAAGHLITINNSIS